MDTRYPKHAARSKCSFDISLFDGNFFDFLDVEPTEDSSNSLGSGSLIVSTRKEIGQVSLTDYLKSLEPVNFHAFLASLKSKNGSKEAQNKLAASLSIDILEMFTVLKAHLVDLSTDEYAHFFAKSIIERNTKAGNKVIFEEVTF